MKSDECLTIEELTVRLDAMREQRKSFLLEAQRKEIEANLLASDLADEQRSSQRLQTALDASEMLRRDMALEIERLKRILRESE